LPTAKGIKEAAAGNCRIGALLLLSKGRGDKTGQASQQNQKR
jgi:hypothetical protein